MVKTIQQSVFLIATAVAGSLLYFYFDPSFANFFPPCPFFKLTGFVCPGCGSQRAFHELLHGHLLGAMSYNILFVLALPLVLYSAVVAVKNIFSNEKWNQPLFNSAFFAKVVLGVVVLFWILRNVPVFPFSWLAP